MFIQKYINTIKQQPIIFFIGICVMLLAIMGTSVHHVASTVFAILVLLSFAIVRDWKKIFSTLSNIEKIFLLTFLLYVVSAIISFYNVDDVDEYVKLFERYFRFVLIIPVYLFLVKKNISVLNYLYAGAVISGYFLFLIALNHYLSKPDEPARGDYHHIIFGQLAMLNVGIMLSMLLTKKISNKIQLIIIASMLCGLAAAIMSQARGVWMVLPFYVVMAVYYSVTEQRIKKKNIAYLLVVIIFLAMFTSIGDLIKQRTDTAISEVTSFYTQDQYISSVGTRLAMWDIAIDVWQKHPLVGTGPGDFDDEIVALQEQGEYEGMQVFNSVHNIYIQALVGTGIIGFLTLVFVSLLMPLQLIYDNSNVNKGGQLAGLVIVISFAVFGLSESWTLRLPAVSVFLIYIVVITAHMKVSKATR